MFIRDSRVSKKMKLKFGFFFVFYWNCYLISLKSKDHVRALERRLEMWHKGRIGLGLGLGIKNPVEVAPTDFGNSSRVTKELQLNITKWDTVVTDRTTQQQIKSERCRQSKEKLELLRASMTDENLFCLQSLQLGLQMIWKLLKLSTVRFARSTMIWFYDDKKNFHFLEHVVCCAINEVCELKYL